MFLQWVVQSCRPPACSWCRAAVRTAWCLVLPSAEPLQLAQIMRTQVKVGIDNNAKVALIAAVKPDAKWGGCCVSHVPFQVSRSAELCVLVFRTVLELLTTVSCLCINHSISIRPGPLQPASTILRPSASNDEGMQPQLPLMKIIIKTTHNCSFINLVLTGFVIWSSWKVTHSLSVRKLFYLPFLAWKLQSADDESYKSSRWEVNLPIGGI